MSVVKSKLKVFSIPCFFIQKGLKLWSNWLTTESTESQLSANNARSGWLGFDKAVHFTAEPNKARQTTDKPCQPLHWSHDAPRVTETPNLFLEHVRSHDAHSQFTVLRFLIKD